MNASTPPDAPATDTPGPGEEFAERLQPQLEELQGQLLETNERVKRFVREHPGATLLGAVALGFVMGRLASRR